MGPVYKSIALREVNWLAQSIGRVECPNAASNPLNARAEESFPLEAAIDYRCIMTLTFDPLPYRARGTRSNAEGNYWCPLGLDSAACSPRFARNNRMCGATVKSRRTTVPHPNPSPRTGEGTRRSAWNVTTNKPRERKVVLNLSRFFHWVQGSPLPPAAQAIVST